MMRFDFRQVSLAGRVRAGLEHGFYGVMALIVAATACGKEW